MNSYNNEKYIVSFTSFGNRFKNAILMLNTLFWQYFRDFHIVMTVFKDDVKDLPKELKNIASIGRIEILVAEENLGPHLKYFYAMKKYWDKPIITVDDDRIYSQNTISSLVSKYEELKFRSIVSNCAVEMSKTGDHIDPRDSWCIGPRRLLPGVTSWRAMPEGFGGVLYPPQAFSNLNQEVENIKKCIYDDDLFLKVLEIKNSLPVTQANIIEGAIGTNGVIGIDIPEAQTYSLAKNHNADMEYRKSVTTLFENELLRAFDHEETPGKKIVGDLNARV